MHKTGKMTCRQHVTSLRNDMNENEITGFRPQISISQDTLTKLSEENEQLKRENKDLIWHITRKNELLEKVCEENRDDLRSAFLTHLIYAAIVAYIVAGICAHMFVFSIFK